MKEGDWQLVRCFVPLLVFSICGLSVYVDIVLSHTCYIFFTNVFLALLQLSCYNLYFCFRLFYETPIFEMPSIIRKKYM